MDESCIETGVDADAELMIAYAAGDADAFDRLYENHRDTLYRFVLHGCGNEAIAGELYQDVWMRVVKQRGHYSADAPFAAWLYRIARNRLIDHYRSREHQHQHDSLSESEQTSVTVIQPSLQPDEVASFQERADSLMAQVQKLPFPQREALLLRHIAGMGVQEIADVLGEKHEAVKSRLRYATTRLRQQLRTSQ